LYVDFSLEEEYLFGSLFITIDSLIGLKQSAGLTNCLYSTENEFVVQHVVYCTGDCCV